MKVLQPLSSANEGKGTGMIADFERALKELLPCIVDCEEVLVNAIGRVTGIKGHTNWVKKELKKSTELQIIVSEFKPGVSRSLAGCFTKHMGEVRCRPKFAPDFNADAVLGDQQWVFSEKFGQIGVTPVAISEVRFLQEGSYFCAGAKADKVRATADSNPKAHPNPAPKHKM